MPYVLPKGKILFQSSFMLMTVQPSAGAAMALGFLYLAAIIDWATRAVLAWGCRTRWIRVLHHRARRSTGADPFS
jgi:hypothetical protein